MRLWITRLFRKKVVLADAALYILCALTSSVALAYTENNGLAHCLSEAGSPAQTARAASGHFYADGTQHEHDGKVVADNCCRVFCISALAITPVMTLPAPELRVPRHFAPAQGPGQLAPARACTRMKEKNTSRQARRAIPRSRYASWKSRCEKVTARCLTSRTHLR